MTDSEALEVMREAVKARMAALLARDGGDAIRRGARDAVKEYLEAQAQDAERLRDDN